ncbi:MAG: hypothetical protein RL344_999 [Pseudomonadota bacterium]|jgi:hypothetical protein
MIIFLQLDINLNNINGIKCNYQYIKLVYLIYIQYIFLIYISYIFNKVF